MIPKDIIDNIFETARIEEVVGDFVTLKKRGANMLGVCPFHDEKTPSFTSQVIRNQDCLDCLRMKHSLTEWDLITKVLKKW